MQRFGVGVHHRRLDRSRRLLLSVRDVKSAQRALTAAGQPAEVLPDGSIELKNASAIEHPENINCLLVKAGTPPTQLMVEEEELEDYFLRLVGMERGAHNE